MRRHTVLCTVMAALVCLLQAAAFAQDDESPEQKKLLATLEQRAQVAASERNLDTTYESPETQLMKEKEAARVGLMAEEEHDVEREASGGYRGYGHGYYR